MDTYTIQITSQAKEHLTLIRDYIAHEEQLDERSTCREFRQVGMEENRYLKRKMPHYHFNMILSSYRIKSLAD